MTKKEKNKTFDLIAGIVIILCIWAIASGKMILFIIFLTVLCFGLITYIYIKQQKKKAYFESRNTLKKIRNLTPDEFEDFIAHVFDKLGYTTKKVGGPSDGGIDVIATKDNFKHYIQCKKYIASKVSVGAVRDFYGAVVDKLSDAKAFFITTNVFTLEAEGFAKDKPMELIDGNALMRYVKMAGIDVEKELSNKSVKSEKCPQCDGELVERVAKRGERAGLKFIGCSNYPKCKYIDNL